MPVNSNFTPGQILTAAQLNTQFGAAAAQSDLNGGATDAGTLTGAETAPVSRGSGVLQTTLTKVAQWIIQTYQGFAPSWAGAVTRTVAGKVGDVVSVADFGCVGDGTDETAKVINAITYAAANGSPLFWPAGKTYSVTNVSVLGGGYVFEWIGHASLKQLSTGNPAVPLLQLGGTVLGTANLTQTSLSQTQTVTLDSASLVQPGYLIRLMTDRLSYGDHQFDPNNAFGQLARVTSVSGSVVQLSDNLVFDLPVSTITTGTAQAGASGSITLSASDTSTSSQLKNYLLTITAGTGAGQSRYINTYNATTKVVDIGTTYTGIPQAAWTTIPDSTSQYSVSATVSAKVIQPAFIKSLANLSLQGYRVANTLTYGLQFEFCDNPAVWGVTIRDCSVTALQDYQNYRPSMIGCNVSGANVNNSGNTTFGFGHASYGSYAPILAYSSFSNCSQSSDSNNTTLFLSRIGNVITGGGLSYDGVTEMWPATTTMQTCGLATHSSTYGVLDQGNVIADVYLNKQRGAAQVTASNVYRGRMQYCNQISYSGGGTYIGNTYDDGFTNEPSSGLNAVVSGDDGLPIVSQYTNRPVAFLNIRFNTMVLNAGIVMKGTAIKSATDCAIYVTDCATPTSIEWPNNISLSLTDTDLSAISSGSLVLGLVKVDGSGAPNFNSFTGMNNTFRVGGSTYLGSVMADNMNPYPFMSSVTTTTGLTYKTGPSKWVCILPASTVTQLDFPVGNTTFKLSIYEKDAVVTNLFSGYVTRGSTTALVTIANTNVTLSTGTPSGTAGTSGQVYFFNRTDSLYISNRTTSACNFVVEIEGAF